MGHTPAQPGEHRGGAAQATGIRSRNVDADCQGRRASAGASACSETGSMPWAGAALMCVSSPDERTGMQSASKNSSWSCKCLTLRAVWVTLLQPSGVPESSTPAASSAVGGKHLILSLFARDATACRAPVVWRPKNDLTLAHAKSINLRWRIVRAQRSSVWKASVVLSPYCTGSGGMVQRAMIQAASRPYRIAVCFRAHEGLGEDVAATATRRGEGL